MTASLGIRVIRSSPADWRSMKKECRHARHSPVSNCNYVMYSTPVDLSFSYLRSSVEASLDIKKDQVEPNRPNKTKIKITYLTYPVITTG